MARYTKTYSSPSQLVSLLQSRGLQVANVARAENYLRHIGYYRFSAYLYPLLTTPKENHVFKSGAAFDQALDMYRFDRHLRLLMFNQIEKIEIAVRSAIVNITSEGEFVGAAGMAPYCSSKHAAGGLSKCVALEVAKENIRVNTIITGGLDIETDPITVKTDLLLRTLGVERNVKAILQLDYDTLSIWPYDSDSTLERMSFTMQDAKRLKIVQALKLLIKCGDYFLDPVEDTVNGMPAKRYDGLFPDEYVEEALVLLDLKEAPEQQPVKPAAERAAGAGNADEGQNANAAEIQSGADAEDETGIGLPGSIWIGEDDMILQVDVDLSGFLQSLSDEFLRKLLETYDLDGLVMEAEIESLDARLTFSQFDAVEKIVVPG